MLYFFFFFQWHVFVVDTRNEYRLTREIREMSPPTDDGNI